MKLHELSPAKGSTKAKKRVGRGPGSGLGKTAGRGMNGQRSRAGYSRRLGFEGGQMPLIRRVPKRGFTNIFRTEYTVINVSQLENFDGDVNPETLRAAGFGHHKKPIKILGNGEITKALNVTAHKFSKSAQRKIEEAGGTCEVIGAAAAEADAAAPATEDSPAAEPVADTDAPAAEEQDS